MAGIYIEKKTKYLPYITGLGAVINIAGNFLLIPSFGMHGAAAATLFSYLSMTLYIYYISQKFYPVKYEINKVILLNIVNMIALAVFYLFYYQVVPSNIIIKIVVMIVLSGVVIYVSGLSKAKVLLRKSASKPAGEVEAKADDDLLA